MTTPRQREETKVPDLLSAVAWVYTRPCPQPLEGGCLRGQHNPVCGVCGGLGVVRPWVQPCYGFFKLGPRGEYPKHAAHGDLCCGGPGWVVGIRRKDGKVEQPNPWDVMVLAYNIGGEELLNRAERAGMVALIARNDERDAAMLVVAKALGVQDA